MPVSAPIASDSHPGHSPRQAYPVGDPRTGSEPAARALARLDHVAIGSERSILEAIRGSVINLAVWRRLLPPGVREAIDAAGPGGFAYIDERFGISERSDVVASWLETSRLPEPLNSWLASDIGERIEDTARLGGAGRVRLKIETIVDIKCGRFHSDMTLLRLISAYHGDGTQFVPDAIADDVFLRDRKPSPEQVLAAPRESVCLLRGAVQADGFSERAIVHRSPDVHRPEDWRLLMAIDALTD